jgi:NADH:ubiquinone oxidoreductase subunit K
MEEAPAMLAQHQRRPIEETGAEASEHTMSAAAPAVTSRSLPTLAIAIIALAAIVASAGLFWPGGDGRTTFTSVHGESIEIYGEGVYRNDSVIRATANKGADVLTLSLAIPLLILALILSLRGSFRGRMLMFGVLVWFLYNSASLALGTGFNALFLVYVALMSTSLFAFVLAFRSIDAASFCTRLGQDAPRRSLAAFMFFAALTTLVVWLEAPLRALLSGAPPDVLEHSTTLITHALDLAIILPVAALSGVLIRRRDPVGYILSIPLLFIVASLAPMIALQTLFQVRAGVEIPLAVAAGPIGAFAGIGLIAGWLIVRLFRSVSAQEVRSAELDA